MNPQLILHLSDLHFGQKSRFAGCSPVDLGIQSADDVLAEVNRLKKNGDVKPSAVVTVIIVTGDITETANPAEYDDALLFFKALAERLDLPLNQIVFTPGNHDVSWSECQKVEIDCKTYQWDVDRFRKELDNVKFKHFNTFVESLYGSKREDLVGAYDLRSGGWVYDFPLHSISIAAVNSCEMESHRTGDHIGSIQKPQLEALRNHWHAPQQPCEMRIIAMHHNPLPPVRDEVNRLQTGLLNLLREGEVNKDIISRFLSDTVGLQGSDEVHQVVAGTQTQLLLHGHHHSDAYIASWSWIGDRIGMCHILSAGAWGTEATPDYHPLGMRLISLDPLPPIEPGIRTFLLEHRPLEWTVSRIGTGRWMVSGSEARLPLWIYAEKDPLLKQTQERMRITNDPDLKEFQEQLKQNLERTYLMMNELKPVIEKGLQNLFNSLPPRQ